MTFALIRTDRADVVRPLCFTASSGRLPGLDHASAALAGLSRSVSEVIFLGLSGGRGIRTHGDVAATMVFKTIAIGH